MFRSYKNIFRDSCNERRLSVHLKLYLKVLKLHCIHFFCIQEEAVVFVIVVYSSGMCCYVVFTRASYEVLSSSLLVVFMSLATVCVGDVLVD
jgi:hypothetical protein